MAPDKRAKQLGEMAQKAIRKAVKKALAEHRRMGVPAVFMRNGKMVYLLPNGRITDKAPVRKSAGKQ